MNELHIQYLITLCSLRGKNMMRSRVVPFALILLVTAQGVGLGGAPPPHTHTFSDGKIHFFLLLLPKSVTYHAR